MRKAFLFIIKVLKNLPTKKPYLFCYYSNKDKESLCIPDDVIQGNAPSQFFRRVFAEYFQKGSNKPFWNWKNPKNLQESENFRMDIIKKTVGKFKNKAKVKEIFECNFNNYSKKR